MTTYKNGVLFSFEERLTNIYNYIFIASKSRDFVLLLKATTLMVKKEATTLSP